MIFIGMINHKKDSKMERMIKQINNEIEIIRMTSKNVLEYQNQKFDMMILEKGISNIDIILNNTRYLIINEDINLNFHSDNLINIITFGFKNKSTATISSIKEDSILISLQRSFKNINNKQILPQEILIEKKEKLNINKYIILKLIEMILN